MLDSPFLSNKSINIQLQINWNFQLLGSFWISLYKPFTYKVLYRVFYMVPIGYSIGYRIGYISKVYGVSYMRSIL